MTDAVQAIIREALGRLSQQVQSDLPPLLAALAIMLVAYFFARLARWLVTRVFKGIQIDQWMRRSGVSAMIDRSGRLRASRIAAQSAFWGVLALGCVAALGIFGTQITTRMAEGFVFLLPKLLAGGVILLAGFWIGQYLGRSMLVCAVNEELPSPRLLAFAVRSLVAFVAIVIAADTVDFASGVFRAAFILILGGVVLTASLAFGIGASDSVRRHLHRRAIQGQAEEEDHLSERSLWNHL